MFLFQNQFFKSQHDTFYFLLGLLVLHKNKTLLRKVFKLQEAHLQKGVVWTVPPFFCPHLLDISNKYAQVWLIINKNEIKNSKTRHK